MFSENFIKTTAFSLAQRFIGLSEIKGMVENHPLIMAMLQLDQTWPENDEVPWCSAFVNFIAWMLRLPRSKSLTARSWLGVGAAVSPEMSYVGFDVVILKTYPAQPGPEDMEAPGHVGFIAGSDPVDSGALIFTSPQCVRVLGGNQSNRVSISLYSTDLILGVRRLYPFTV